MEYITMTPEEQQRHAEAENNMRMTPRERRKTWLEAQKAKLQPTEQPKTEPTEQDALKALFAKLPKDEVEKLIEEYQDDTDFVSFASAKTEPKQEEINEVALWTEYNERLAKIPNGQPYALIALKKEFRQRGLKVY